MPAGFALGGSESSESCLPVLSLRPAIVPQTVVQIEHVDLADCPALFLLDSRRHVGASLHDAGHTHREEKRAAELYTSHARRNGGLLGLVLLHPGGRC